jgi:hypothetical protein
MIPPPGGTPRGAIPTERATAVLDRNGDSNKK